MAALFALAAVVQLNDPDPVRWAALYGAAALACARAARGPADWRLPAVIAVVAAAWAVVWESAGVRALADEKLFREVGMMSAAVEEGREFLGLVIVAAWMTGLAWRDGRRAAPRAATERSAA